MKKLAYLLSLFLPWEWRRPFLEKQFGYSLHPTSRIGFAWILPRRLVLEEGARIGHFNLCKNIDLLHLGPRAVIAQLNWITGYPTGTGSRHFAHQPERKPELILERHAGISSRHFIDCTAQVKIGAFATIAGYRSQIISHSIDLAANRQSSEPIRIGEYCFIGTEAVILGGSALPDHSVLAAKSLLNKRFETSYQLYAGVPAQPIKELDRDMKYFSREEGFVW